MTHELYLLSAYLLAVVAVVLGEWFKREGKK